MEAGIRGVLAQNPPKSKGTVCGSTRTGGGVSLGPRIPALCPFLWLGYCKKQLEAYPTPRPCSQAEVWATGIMDAFCRESVVSRLQECLPTLTYGLAQRKVGLCALRVTGSRSAPQPAPTHQEDPTLFSYKEDCTIRFPRGCS